MKTLAIYLICSALLFVGLILTCGGGLWSLCGFAWWLMCYVSGLAFPQLWRKFWFMNIRILAYFGCL